jgi:hypothetical protein
MIARQRDESFKNEVKRNILETTILNELNPQELDISWFDSAGIAVVNSVRLLSLKPLLELQANRANLTHAKYAFYMERNRRYEVAAVRYQDLAARLDGDEEIAAFVGLHGGFCVAITGRTEEAIARLEETRDGFPGTHYAETATLLIHILREGQRRRRAIDGRGMSDRDRARAMFDAKLHADARMIYDEVGEDYLQAMDRYRLNRSREETGQIPLAIQGYVDIINRNRDPEAVREANRRLLLLGTFGGAGSRVREYAENNANELGDDEALQQIQEAAEETRAAVIIQELKADSATRDRDFQDLERELETTIALDSHRHSRPRPLVPPAGLRAGSAGVRPAPRTLRLDPIPMIRTEESGRLLVEFSDGRKLRAKSLIIHENEIEITGDVEARSHPSVIVRIRLFDHNDRIIRSRGELSDTFAITVAEGKSRRIARGYLAKFNGDRLVVLGGDGPGLELIPRAGVLRIESP